MHLHSYHTSRGRSRLLLVKITSSILTNHRLRHRMPKETQPISFYIFLFISIQIKNKVLCNTSRGEADRRSSDRNQVFERGKVLPKDECCLKWKFQFMLGLFDSTCGPKRGRLFRRLSEAEDSASRFLGAFFLSHVW